MTTPREPICMNCGGLNDHPTTRCCDVAVHQLKLKQQELDGARIEAERQQARLGGELIIARELVKIYGRLSFWERLRFAFTGGLGPKP